jgi:hypothetical protein
VSSVFVSAAGTTVALVAQVPSPLKKVDELGVPVADIPPTGKPVAFVRVNDAGVPIASPFGSVVLILGTEPAEVTNTPLAAVDRPETAVPEAAYQAT